MKTPIWFVTIMAMLLASGWAFFAVKHASLTGEHETLMAAQVTLEETNLALEADVASLEQLNTEVNVEKTHLLGLIEAKEGFTQAIATVKTAFENAADKVNVEEQLEKVKQSQTLTLEAETVDAIKAETDKVLAIVAEVDEIVKAYNEEQERLEAQRKYRAGVAPEGSNTPPPTGDWLGEYRNILSQYGGGWVPVTTLNGTCIGISAWACAYNGDYVIAFSPRTAGWSYQNKVWLAVHEYAHIVQFSNWGTVESSPGYHSLFGSNIEHMADCMAVARGTINFRGAYCSSEHIDAANKLWRGQMF